MKVVDVKATVVAHPMPPLHGGRWGGTQEISLVEVVTDEGIVGYGLASYPNPGPDGMVMAPIAPGLGMAGRDIVPSPRGIRTVLARPTMLTGVNSGLIAESRNSVPV